MKVMCEAPTLRSIRLIVTELGIPYQARASRGRSHRSSRRSDDLPGRLGKLVIGRRVTGEPLEPDAATRNAERPKGEPTTWKLVRSVCAVRRVVVSLLQAGGTEERFLGYWYSWRRKLKVTKHARQAAHARKRCRAGRSYDPLPMRKAELPEPES